MRTFWTLLFACVCLSFAVSAQQAVSPSVLSAEQREGRRIFQQKCALCHVPASSLAEPYAPKLTRGLVEGNENSIRETITNGSGPRMPGWKYTLQPNQINNVIEYLKILDKSTRTIVSERPEGQR